MNKVLSSSDKNEGLNIANFSDQNDIADLDYKFAQNFTQSGGFFNYCSDEAEALNVLNQIIKIEDIESTFCWDPELINFLDVLNSNYTKELKHYNDAAFITCEYLIAFDGRIMLSSNNILHYQSFRLPERIIILANVSQIVNNLNDAMMLVKRRETLKNLTSISGSHSKLDIQNQINPKLFLLLLED